MFSHQVSVEFHFKCVSESHIKSEVGESIPIVDTSDIKTSDLPLGMRLGYIVAVTSGGAGVDFSKKHLCFDMINTREDLVHWINKVTFLSLIVHGGYWYILLFIQLYPIW